MKTRTIKLGLSVLTVFISFSLMSTNLSITDNENESAIYSSQEAIEVIDENSTLVINEIVPGEPATLGLGDSFYNSPDPFMHVTTIYYSLGENTIVNLTVYSADQGPVVLIQNEKQQRGEHSVKFSAKGMKPGSYWAVLETGSGVQFERMTKRGGISFSDGIAHKE